LGISTPVPFFTGPATTIASGSATAATGTNCPAGSLVVVALLGSSGGQIQNLFDSAGNNYTRAVRQAAARDAELWYCANNVDLPASGTFTANTFGAITWRPYGAAYVTGALGGLDEIAGITITGTGFTLTSGPLGFASAIAFGMANDVTGFTSFTEDASWFPLIGNPSSNLAAGDFAYKIVSTNAPVSWSPTYSPSQEVDAAMAVFDATLFGVGYVDIEW
jgi:hypothetical protein